MVKLWILKICNFVIFENYKIWKYGNLSFYLIWEFWKIWYFEQFVNFEKLNVNFENSNFVFLFNFINFEKFTVFWKFSNFVKFENLKFWKFGNFVNFKKIECLKILWIL